VSILTRQWPRRPVGNCAAELVQGCAACLQLMLQPEQPEDRGSISGGDKQCFSAPYVETGPGTDSVSLFPGGQADGPCG